MNKLTRRLFSLVLPGCLLLQLLSPALAAGNDGTLYIYNAEELVHFVQSCSYDAWSQEKTVSLERDISLSGVDFLPAASFSGTFEGNGHTISDLTITQSVSPAGFFGILQEGAVVRDLKVAGTVSPDGSGENVGGIAGINRGTITGCSFTGTVEGKHATGGIAGENSSTGVIQRSTANGGVFGKSMTGGVAGRNSGTLSSCAGNAYVNTNTVDPTVSLSDLDLDLRDGLQKLMSPDTFNVATDSGGVAGFSDGLILTCQNHGTVGYQHIGYNVGGIAGRSGGHVSGCTNTGKIYGRRGVGGIVGVAEPNVIRDVSESALEEVRRELDTLNALVNKASRDADATSSTLSGRLTSIGDSVDTAQDRARDLTDTLTDYWDGTVAEIDRGSEILDSTIDRLGEVTTQARKASDTLTDALDATEQALSDLTQAGQGGTSAFDDLGDMAIDLRVASEILDDGLAQLSDGLELLDDVDWAGKLRSMNTGLTGIRQGLKTTADGLAAITAALGAMADQIRDGELPDTAALKAGFDKSRDGLRMIQGGFDSLHGLSDREINLLDSGTEHLKAGFDILANGRSGDFGGVFLYLGWAMEELESVAKAAQISSQDLQRAVGLLRDSSGEMTAALREAEKLVNYLQDQDRLTFSALGTAADASADGFYDSLHDISNHLELLNTEAKADSDMLTEDLRRINNQFTRVMDVLLDAVEDAENASASDVVEDTSDEDIDAVTQGKVFLSTNAGAVAGDIDVGGVAGAMEVYNDLNPEEDDQLTLSSLLHRRYQLKCVLQDCANTGEVTGKRNNVGAVCGDARLGVISGCMAYGAARSESGDNVGGVAGYGDNTIRKCWAKCSLSGRSYVGGIVGYADSESTNCTVDRCRSLVEITDCGQHGGAIAGTDAGVFSGNLFVSDTLAGLDRVSYRNRAQPVSYGELLEEDGLPYEFRRFFLTFRTEDTVVKSLRFHYGDSLDEDTFPAVPARAGMYGKWDREELRDLRFDTTVNAVYAPYVTALPSPVTRSAARPVFFVTGDFNDAARLEASPVIMDFDLGQEGFWQTLRSYHRDVLEQWHLTCPDNGDGPCTVRYLPPEAGPEQLAVYASTGSGWERLETRQVGSYLAFQVPDREADVTVLSTATPWWVWGLLAVLALGVVLLALTFLIRKKTAPQVLTEEEKAKAAKRAKLRKRIRIVLLAVVAALAIAVGALLRFAPQVTTGMELYRLLRSYAERSQLAMRLEVSTHLDGADFDTGLDLRTTDFEGKRLLQADWQGIPLYYCDGVILLENGKSFRLDDTLPNYSNLLPYVAGIYRTMDISATELNGVKTYHATAEGKSAQTLLSLLLPRNVDALPVTDGVGVDVITTDGELTAIRIGWNGGERSASGELTFPQDAAQLTLPQPVSAALRSGEYTKAQPVGDDLRRLLLACADLSARDPLTAQVNLSANCGPLLLNEELTWQLTHRYNRDLSRVGRRGAALWFTRDTACLDNGLSASLGDAQRMDAGALLGLTYQAILLGEPGCDPTSDGYRYSVTLDADAMSEFARVIAPETGSMNIGFDSGSVTLTVRDDAVTDLSIRCRGTMHIVLTDVSASVSAQLVFDRDTAFPQVPEKVLTTLGLE